MDFASDCAVTCALLGFLAFLVAWWYHERLWKPYAGLPSCNYAYHFLRLFLAGGFPRHLPTAGCFLHFHNALSELFRKEGFFVGWSGYFHIHVFSPEATKFFITDPAVKEKGSIYRLLKIGLGQGLVTCNTKTASKHKRIIKPALHKLQLQSFVAVFNRQSAKLIKELEIKFSSPSVDLLDVLEQRLFECALETVIGVDPEEVGIGPPEVEECREAVLKIADYLTSRAFKPWLFFDCLLRFFPGGAEALSLIKSSRGTIRKAMDNYLKSEEIRRRSKKCDANWERWQNDLDNNNASKSKALVPLLVEAYYRDPEAFTLKDVQDEIITVILGAYHTVVLSSFWTMYLLGLHPDIQEVAHKEIRAKMTDQLTHEDLEDMPFLECIIKESLRIYPPIPAVVRRLDKEVQFGKYTVPPGTEVFFWMYMLHRDPNVFPNPEVFDPSRFASDKDPINRFSYMPFADGSRTCIGKAFTMIELKVLLAHIIRKFKIVSLDPRDRINLTWNIVLPPVEKPRIQLIPRLPTCVQT